MVQSERRLALLPAAARSPRSWLSVMTATGLIGGGLAISRATESHWQLRMSLSRLGVDHGSAWIVTLTSLGLGMSLLALGWSLERTFAGLRSTGRLSRWAARLLSLGFIVAGVAVALTGLFPINNRNATIIHNLAGFTFPIVLMTTIAGGRLAIGSLGGRFDRFSAGIIAGVVVLFVATHWLSLMPYGLMELICFGLIGSWLWLFEARLRSLMHDGLGMRRQVAAGGRLPVSSGRRLAWRSSSVAEQGTHKPLVGGSNPPSATRSQPD